MDDDAEAVLSDVEGEEQPVSVVVDADFSADRYRDLLAELERERAGREAAEASKSEIQTSFLKIKFLAHEAIKKRDEAVRERDEALRKRDEVIQEKEDAIRMRDEATREKEDALRLGVELVETRKQLEQVVSERDDLRSEIEKSRHMLSTGIEKISGKVSCFKNFAASGGLPRSQKYTGLPSTAYGVIKRTNEIVEEMIKQVDSASKSRNEVREQMDQRNYEIAIEVSQLEATINGLRDEVASKDKRLELIEKEAEERAREVGKEGERMNKLIDEYEVKLAGMESRMDSQMVLLVDQLSFVGKIHNRLYEAIKILDTNSSDSEFSESLFLPQQMDAEESLRASLAGMESIHELTRIVAEKTKDIIEEKNREITNLNERVCGLLKEKEHFASLLRSALSKRLNSDSVSEKKEFLQAAENGLREAGINLNFAKGDRDGSLNGEDEIYSLAGALENIVKSSQQEIMELRQSLEILRAESLVLQELNETQAKELHNRMRRIQELEASERSANENIEGLMMDIATAEEEIQRWKVAAEQEAAAGGAVEQEFAAQLAAARRELEEMKQSLVESEKKLRFKEETAAAAMAAREAAERSLVLADTRASRLRERVEELSRQLEEQEAHREAGVGSGRRYVCWPWRWLGMDFAGGRGGAISPQSLANEMELSEPLL